MGNPSLNTENMISRARLILEFIFIAVFSCFSLPHSGNLPVISRIWGLSISIYVLSLIPYLRFNKANLKNLLNPTLIFFAVFSIAQTIKNISTLGGSYVFISEITHYLLLIFILVYNFKKIRIIDTGLALFIAYSFRIFDSNLFDNEFILPHGLTVILALHWLEELYSKTASLIKTNSIFVSFGALIIGVFLSFFSAVCPYNHFAQAAVMLNFIFIAFLIGNYVRDIKQIKLIIFTLFFMGGILSALVLSVILHREGLYNVLSSRIWIERQSVFRIHPNSIAGYFSVLLFLTIASISFYKRKIFKIGAKVSVFIIAAILFLTYSRLGIFSCIFSAGVLFILRYGEAMKFIKMHILSIFLSISASAILISFTPMKQGILGRIFSPATSQTLYSCKNALMAIKDRPLFGLGFDNYYILSKYAKEQILVSGGIGTGLTQKAVWTPVHSLYLGIVFGLGIFGLLAFIWLLVNTAVYFIKLNKSIAYDSSESKLLQTIFAAFISIIIHGTLAMTFHLTILPGFFWILIGLLIAIGNVVNFNKTAVYAFNSLKLCGLSAAFLISIYAVVSLFIGEKFYNVAIGDFNSGKISSAQKNINRAKIFIPIQPKLYELEAEIKSASGLIDDAMKSYKQALAFKRDFAFYHTRIGQLYKQKKMYPYALLELEKAINLDKYGVCYQEHYSDLGGFYRELGSKEEAVLQFKKALIIQPQAACAVDWKGAEYLEEILSQVYRDYSALKNKNPLAAQQILFNIDQVNRCKKSSVIPGVVIDSSPLTPE